MSQFPSLYPRMKSAVTISLVPEAVRGPFVYHCPGGTGLTLAMACQEAADRGFDAVEIFAADGEHFPRLELRALCEEHGLAVAAVGTGAGWLKHGLSLTDPDHARRAAAVEFVRGLIAVAAEFDAPAIIGSMQGRSAAGGDRPAALGHLAESLRTLSATAAAVGQPLLYEPLNRYETDLFNQQATAAEWLRGRGLRQVRLLCDLFHMNIEEAEPAAALEAVGDFVGHVHWADSNRQAIGFGHTQVEPIVAALRRIGYAGYLSAEVFPLPSPAAAARQTIASLQHQP